MALFFIQVATKINSKSVQLFTWSNTEACASCEGDVMLGRKKEATKNVSVFNNNDMSVDLEIKMSSTHLREFSTYSTERWDSAVRIEWRMWSTSSRLHPYGCCKPSNRGISFQDGQRVTFDKFLKISLDDILPPKRAWQLCSQKCRVCESLKVDVFIFCFTVAPAIDEIGISSDEVLVEVVLAGGGRKFKQETRQTWHVAS